MLKNTLISIIRIFFIVLITIIVGTALIWPGVILGLSIGELFCSFFNELNICNLPPEYDWNKFERFSILIGIIIVWAIFLIIILKANKIDIKK